MSNRQRVEPPAGLEDRTVAAMAAARAEQKAEPGGHPDAGDHDAEDLAVTRICAGGATARATARQARESWTFDLSVHGLKPLPGNDVYECWWVGPGSTSGGKLLVTRGSFVVGKSGSATLTMTTGADPRQFRTMEITAESPGNGALPGPVLLTGQTLLP